MAKFTFSLEGVLRHRKHVEQDCMVEVSRLQQQVRDAENELRQLDQSLGVSLGDVRANRLTGKLDLGFLAAYRRYVASVHRKGALIAQRMAVIQRQVDIARAALAEAAKQRKIVEKLREKQLERWKSEMAHKEAADLDEVNTRLTAWRAAMEQEGVAVEE